MTAIILRVLPIVGRGSVQSVADILFLQGVDIGIVRADTLDYLERKGLAKDIKRQFTYITKLYNEEMQVIAPKSIHNLHDLEGKTVSVDLPNGSTFVTVLTVAERIGMKANFVYIEQRVAMEKLKKGEVDAVIVVGGKPYKSVSTFNNDGRFHLVKVDYEKPLQGDYLPTTLTSKDYPNLIADGETVDTIAVPALLAAYNWSPKTDRYRKLTNFVNAFFTKFPQFQKPPFHPKWTEVSLSAPLPGWNRFQPAQDWLNQHGIQPVTRDRFETFLAPEPGHGGKAANQRRQGSAVQAIPGLGSVAERQGAGTPAAIAADTVRKQKEPGSDPSEPGSRFLFGAFSFARLPPPLNGR